MKIGKELVFLALGGSGEIGMNVNLYGCDGKWLMVDLGMTFSGNEYPGVDLVFADLEFIEDRKADLLGIVLTHGHEDHIGGRQGYRRAVAGDHASARLDVNRHLWRSAFSAARAGSQGCRLRASRFGEPSRSEAKARAGTPLAESTVRSKAGFRVAAPLRSALQGSPSQWPQEFYTGGELGPDRPYTLDTIQPPFDNPWKALMFFAGVDFDEATGFLATGGVAVQQLTLRASCNALAGTIATLGIVFLAPWLVEVAVQFGPEDYFALMCVAFITVSATPWLTNKHTIFGEVADAGSRGVVDAIAAVPVGAQDRPKDAVVIESITVESVDA